VIRIYKSETIPQRLLTYAIENNEKGTTTIDVLNLKKHHKEARRKHLHRLKRMHESINPLQKLNNAEAQRMVIRIRQN
jgi:hypothetical protein